MVPVFTYCQTVLYCTCASAHPHVYGLDVTDLWQTALDTCVRHARNVEKISKTETGYYLLTLNKIHSNNIISYYSVKLCDTTYPKIANRRPAASSLPTWSGQVPSRRPSKTTPKRWPRSAWWADNSGPDGNPRYGSGKTGPPGNYNCLENIDIFIFLTRWIKLEWFNKLF